MYYLLAAQLFISLSALCSFNLEPKLPRAWGHVFCFNLLKYLAQFSCFTNLTFESIKAYWSVVCCKVSRKGRLALSLQDGRTEKVKSSRDFFSTEMEQENPLLLNPTSLQSWFSLTGAITELWEFTVLSHPLPAGELCCFCVWCVRETLSEEECWPFPIACDTWKLCRWCPSSAEHSLPESGSDFSKCHSFQKRSLWCT